MHMGLFIFTAFLKGNHNVSKCTGDGCLGIRLLSAYHFRLLVMDLIFLFKLKCLSYSLPGIASLKQCPCIKTVFPFFCILISYSISVVG